MTIAELFDQEREAGFKEGIEEIEKEREKAEKERKSKEKAILKFYNRGFSIKELAEDFDMSIEEIKKIIK